MTPALVLLLLSAASQVELVDEMISIPPSEWRYVELNLKQQPAAVECEYSCPAGARVTVAVLRRDDMERLREDRPHGVMAATGPGAGGTLRFDIPEPGEYIVVAYNRLENRAAKVHLRVALDFSRTTWPRIRYVPSQRRAVVILAGFGFFFGVVIFSARRLHGARG